MGGRNQFPALPSCLPGTLWPLPVVNEDKMCTVPLGLALFENQLSVRYSHIMAITMYGAVPVFLIFMILQRSFVEGVALTSLKES